MELFTISKPTTAAVPILLSIPHAGTFIPEAIRSQLHPAYRDTPPDTDWFVDKLYQFAKHQGITTIKANYSRYVVDLNRAPDSSPNYADKRRQTTVVPDSTFLGAPLYLATNPDEQAITERLNTYYWPYYKAIEETLGNLKSNFSAVLLFDAHSIKRKVATIQTQPFPCLTLGDVNGTSACEFLVSKALNTLMAEQPYQTSYNQPFRGGHITRYFSDPNKKTYCLQLEMAQDIYMNEESLEIIPERFAAIEKLLMKLMENLIDSLGKLQ